MLEAFITVVIVALLAGAVTYETKAAVKHHIATKRR